MGDISVILGGRDWNFTSTSNGIELALQRLDLLLDRDDLVELGCRQFGDIHG